MAHSLVKTCSRHSGLFSACGFFLGVILIQLVLALNLTEGTFTFALDDPYIHLALAENIARGHYGINLREPSSPASSILWPYLLAPFASSAYAVYGVLFLCLACALATLVYLERIVRPGATQAVIFYYLFSAVFLFNLVGLVFTGMEHSLQILMVVLVVVGLIEQIETGRASKLLFFAILVGPLVRYENAAVSVAAIAFVLMQGRVLQAFILFISLGLLLGAFSAFLLSLHLPPLPSSVLVKLHGLHGMQDVAGILDKLWRNLWNKDARKLTVMLLPLFYVVAASGFNKTQKQLALSAVFAVLLQMAVGRFGWFGQYEVYAWTFELLIIVYLFRDKLNALLSQPKKLWYVGVPIFVVLSLGCASYYKVFSRIPVASQNIYDQQHQMGRFVRNYWRGPVAVNDIGQVSYRNPHYVLDLWGLASPVAFDDRQAGTPNWMEQLVRRKHIELAMIYRDWFKGVPDSWVRVARLVLDEPRATVSRRVVAIYATAPEYAPRIRADLKRFEPTLPAQDILLFDPLGSP